MSSVDKNTFVKEMTKAYKDAIGSKKNITSKELICICYGIKT